MIAAIVAASVDARAQDNSAAVEALFTEGKRLVAEGKVAEACPKFLASYNLEPRLGTLLNLADCYEKNGQLASAWARFVEARTLAQRAGQQERADYASEHAMAVEPKLSRLVVAVAKPAPGEIVKRDGAVVEAGVFGVAVPIDPGKHLIEASAPGKRTWNGSIDVGGNADRKTIEVPVLEDAPKTETAVGPSADPAAGSEKSGPSTRTLVGLAVVGAGVVAIGVGGVFGVVALGKNSDSEAHCGQNGAGPNDCYSEGIQLREDAVSAGNLSTVFIAVGSALVVGGLVLWLTAPSAKAAQPRHPLGTVVF